MSDRRETHPALRSTLPSWRAAIGPGLLWGLIFSVSISVGLVAAYGFWHVLRGEAVSARGFVFGAAALNAVLFPIGALAGIMRYSRAFADKAFVGLGMLATCFGLAMLVLFFGQMIWDTKKYFRYTPQMIREHNEMLRDRVTQQENIILAEMEKTKAEMHAEMKKAADDQERAEIKELFEKEILPGKLSDLKKNADDFIQARNAGVREDLSGWGIFVFFLANGPSNVPQDAGIFPALIGSLYIGLITILFAVPIGIGAAIYLEEYKSKGRMGKILGGIIQININNLAGVPSVVYGILGGWAFVQMMIGLQQYAPWDIAPRNLLGGGLTLALLTLPVVIVATQEAIRAVPDSIRHGAYAVGATHWQTIRFQVLPLAWPGILTGAILSLSRAIGEAAPLVLFGALLFVDQTPGLFQRFTVLPMQIFAWADRPAVLMNGETVEVWQHNAAFASLVLLVMLLSLNAAAIWMRNRAQQRLKW
ncbi:MAG: phosphate ABC transporter permease PstA [Gemmataceae bacterium]|nr:phosphate ABC transporter permease PstA [Gemmataceae bacterium]